MLSTSLLWSQVKLELSKLEVGVKDGEVAAVSVVNISKKLLSVVFGFLSEL